jgi:hypothetical protein
MGSVGDVQATGGPTLAQSHGFGRRWFDAAAVALLSLGCLTGTVVLLVQGGERGGDTSPPEPGLRQRVRELEQRLLEQVPAAIEQRYRDY